MSDFRVGMLFLFTLIAPCELAWLATNPVEVMLNTGR